MVQLPDGSLVLAGYSDASANGSGRDFALARLDSNGNLHPAFNGTGRLKTDFAGGLDGAYALVLQPDSKLVAAGEATIGGTRGFALARYDLLGALDETFGSAGLKWVDPSPHSLAIAFSLALQLDGKLVAAGVGIGANQDFAVARLFGDAPINQPPVFTGIDVLTPSVSEGGFADLRITVTDPDSTDALSLTVDWGDGGTPDSIAVSAGSTIVLSHRYKDDPAVGPDVFTISLTLHDSVGAQATPQTRMVTVNNGAPSLSIAVSPTTFNAGATTTLSGTINDPGVLDSHTVSIDWGDGSTVQEVVMAAGVTAIPSTPHVYARAGSYTINASARDDDGGNAMAISASVTVFEIAPAAPSGLVATPVSPTRIDLSWTDNSNNEVGFEVQRCNRFAKMCQVFTERGSSYADLTVRKGTTYQYSVRAFNSAGASTWVGPILATTPR